MRKQAAAVYVPLMEAQDPRLQELVETRNQMAKLVVDLKIDETDETINAEQESFELLTRFASSDDIDILDLIELSPLRNKEELIRKIEKRRQARVQATGNVAVIEAENRQADTQVKKMKAAETQQSAIQKRAETLFMLEKPERTRVVV